MTDTLNIKTSLNKIPTIEVDLASLPDNADYRSFSAAVLNLLGENYPDLTLTFYSYLTKSLNFIGRETDSVFLGISGADENMLHLILSGYNSFPGIEVRFSDYIPASVDLLDIHLENGKVYARTNQGVWEHAM